MPSQIVSIDRQSATCYGRLIRSAGFDAGERERQQGLNIVNAAVEAKVQHFIWSCVPLDGSIGLVHS